MSNNPPSKDKVSLLGKIYHRYTYILKRNYIYTHTHRNITTCLEEITYLQKRLMRIAVVVVIINILPTLITVMMVQIISPDGYIDGKKYNNNNVTKGKISAQVKELTQESFDAFIYSAVTNAIIGIIFILMFSFMRNINMYIIHVLHIVIVVNKLN